MTLSALEKSGTGGLLFVARRAGKTGFYAERFGTVGRIGLLSFAYALGPRSSFTSDAQVSYGTVDPPKPFVGTATLRREPGGKRTWTGDLAAPSPARAASPWSAPSSTPPWREASLRRRRRRVMLLDAKPAPTRARITASTSATPQAQVEPLTAGGGGDSGSSYRAVTASGKLAAAVPPSRGPAPATAPTIGV